MIYQEKNCMIVNMNESFSRDIGTDLAIEFAKRGSNLILTSSTESFDTNKNNINSKIEKIEETTKENGTKLTIKKLDCDSLLNIASFVSEIENSLEQPINYLIIFPFIPNETDHVITEEGFDSVYSAIYLSCFLLVQLLIPSLDKSLSKIILGVSKTHFKATGIYLNDILPKLQDITLGYDTIVQAAFLALTLFSRELAHELKNNKNTSNVTINCCQIDSQSFITTKTYVNLPDKFSSIVNDMFLLPDEDLVNQLAYNLLSLEIQDSNGLYFIEYKSNIPNNLTFDSQLRKTLYKISKKYTFLS
eukprot:TRINITY_DN3776_c0_g2_i1.p1 TRINITY_DN3776_c0_g2~~TRINITY_DN3776_c0_g2_i1.p1  ORF type:complete len:304 (+),score=81.61 TRINITY_DN3776_c0_g2_i1:267-1178(+)